MPDRKAPPVREWEKAENFAAQVQHAKALLERGDEAMMIAYLLRRSVEDVRRVLPVERTQEGAS